MAPYWQYNKFDCSGIRVHFVRLLVCVWEYVTLLLIVSQRKPFLFDSQLMISS